MDPQLVQLMTKVGRPGWIVTGSKDETKKVSGRDEGNNPITTDEATGNKILTISSPDGRQIDSIIVTPPVTATPIGGTTAWPTTATGGTPVDLTADYAVVQGPQKEVPADPRTAANQPPTPSAINEAALNVERDQNAKNSPYGRVTNAELASLNRAAATAGRQLTNDEKNQALAQSREDRLAATDQRNAAAQQATQDRLASNQADSNSIARQRLALDQQKAAADASKPDVRVIGNQLVDTATGQVRYTAPEATTKLITAQDGTIQIVDLATGTSHTVWEPNKPPQLLPGQKPDQKQFVQQDARTGAISAVDNPIYTPQSVQQWQSLQDGITAIQGMLTRGEIDFPTAAKYKDALQQNFDAALQGTTPYQQYQDKQAAALQRAQTGASLLNQRVSSGSGLAQSLVNGAIGIAGNKNFIDPSAVAGLSIFGGANSIPEFLNGLGGGQGVQDAASGAVQQGLGGQGKPDYASALVQAALGQGGNTPPSQPQQAQQALLPAGAAGTVPPNDPRYMGSQPGGPIQRDPQFLNDQRHMGPQVPAAYDPAAILLQAALAGGLQSF